ncbi:uncharacterized protein [Watersipora subatra]|uniref:uncharacterized protein n=1 Tax=Watersipora subatra TaxID=2589382 RepID=UPI00355C8A9F
MKKSSRILCTLLGAGVTLLLLLKMDASFSISTISTTELSLSDPLAKRWNISTMQNQYYMVTMLSLFCGQRWQGYEDFTMAELDERDKEYIEALQSNLNHPLIKEVHLLYTDDKALEAVRDRKLDNRVKIIPVKMRRRVHMMDFFHYAAKFLLNKPVIALNGDIVVGEGFDLIDTAKMAEEKVLYTLSRHGNLKGNCTAENYCLEKLYQGSHDTHIFRLKQPLDEALLLRLDYPINMWQAENGMIGAFLYFFNFKVYNPCKTLRTYHQHCSKVHKRGKKNSIKDPPYKWRSNLLGKAPPISDLLY